jgi:hypothetical protein
MILIHPRPCIRTAGPATVPHCLTALLHDQTPAAVSVEAGAVVTTLGALTPTPS